MEDTRYPPSGIPKKSNIYLYDGINTELNNEILRVFRGYYKIESLVYFSLLELPTPKVIAIIAQWDGETRNKLQEYAKRQGLTHILLRSDQKDEIGSAPRLGLCVTLQDIERCFLGCLDGNRVLFLLEPRSRYDNLYSFNLLFHPDNVSDIIMEVVGPGFDASDLKRGDITPHETIRLPRTAQMIKISEVEREILPDPQYRENVLSRLEKIGKEVALVSNVAIPSRDSAKLRELALEYLHRSGQTLLLQRKEHYPSIPVAYLREIYGLVAGLPKKMKNLGIRGEPFVISGSIFNLDKRVGFWEFTWPELKYEALFREIRRERRNS